MVFYHSSRQEINIIYKSKRESSVSWCIVIRININFIWNQFVLNELTLKFNLSNEYETVSIPDLEKNKPRFREIRNLLLNTRVIQNGQKVHLRFLLQSLISIYRGIDSRVSKVAKISQCSSPAYKMVSYLWTTFIMLT